MTAHLSAEELAEFREIFNLVDLDKGGTISKEELRQLMTTLGLKPSQVRASEPVGAPPRARHRGRAIPGTDLRDFWHRRAL